MDKKMLAGWALALLALPAVAPAAETRCGWLENPTPGNWWLIDGDGEWTLATQGDDSVPEASMARLPELRDGEFVRTNGNHGFACVCLRVDVDRAAGRIVRVLGGEQLLLKRCMQDPRVQHKIPLR